MDIIHPLQMEHVRSAYFPAVIVRVSTEYRDFDAVLCIEDVDGTILNAHGQVSMSRNWPRQCSESWKRVQLLARRNVVESGVGLEVSGQ
jgi:hypothetical protein